jgi:hypothetical protein
MPENLAHNPRICLMAVTTSTKLWLPALITARFSAPPGVRLLGEVSKLLWGDLRRVRDMRFDAFAPVRYPVMCESLWGEALDQV